MVGPASARLFVASALARQGPLLVVTATGREADDLTAELRGVFGDAVDDVPVLGDAAARAAFARRGHRRRPDDAAAPAGPPEDARLGPPLRVVVTAVRSLLQPMAPRLGRPNR